MTSLPETTYDPALGRFLDVDVDEPVNEAESKRTHDRGGLVEGPEKGPARTGGEVHRVTSGRPAGKGRR